LIKYPETYIAETNQKQPNKQQPIDRKQQTPFKPTTTFNNKMQTSVFTYLAKNYNRNTSTSVKVLLFVKLDDDTVFVKASTPGRGMGIDVMMSYDQLMKHKYLKAYYELSLTVIGKPNLDPEYGLQEEDAKYYEDTKEFFIDAMYIIEDILTKEKVAKKGDSYHSEYLREDTTVATDAELAEFNAAYDAKFDETYFDDRIATYKALVSQL
jgi:hypothetical protein